MKHNFVEVSKELLDMYENLIKQKLQTLQSYYSNSCLKELEKLYKDYVTVIEKMHVVDSMEKEVYNKAVEVIFSKIKENWQSLGQNLEFELSDLPRSKREKIISMIKSFVENLVKIGLKELVKI